MFTVNLVQEKNVQSWLLSPAFTPLSAVPHHYPKAVRNYQAVHRKSFLLSLGSLMMQIWCNVCGVAPQGCIPRRISVGRATKRHRIMASKRTKPLLSPPRWQCTSFQAPEVPLVKHAKLFQYCSVSPFLNGYFYR